MKTCYISHIYVKPETNRIEEKDEKEDTASSAAHTNTSKPGKHRLQALGFEMPASDTDTRIEYVRTFAFGAGLNGRHHFRAISTALTWNQLDKQWAANNRKRIAKICVGNGTVENRSEQRERERKMKRAQSTRYTHKILIMNIVNYLNTKKKDERTNKRTSEQAFMVWIIHVTMLGCSFWLRISCPCVMFGNCGDIGIKLSLYFFSCTPFWHKRSFFRLFYE